MTSASSGVTTASQPPLAASSISEAFSRRASTSDSRDLVATLFSMDFRAGGGAAVAATPPSPGGAAATLVVWPLPGVGVASGTTSGPVPACGAALGCPTVSAAAASSSLACDCRFMAASISMIFRVIMSNSSNNLLCSRKKSRRHASVTSCVLAVYLACRSDDCCSAVTAPEVTSNRFPPDLPGLPRVSMLPAVSLKPSARQTSRGSR
mmetsp:Transcript_23978/g.59784  ORF Transcript_23978/g.59784 Transcript_23978/m.59784 type:complete len:208 (-) Transcript_23978:228-851(-)